MGFTLSEINKQIEEEKTEKQIKNKRQNKLIEEAFRSSLRSRDKNQEEVIDTSLDKFLVTGPAGSGKTILCNLKVIQLEEKNSNYILIIYTKALKRFLEGKLNNCNLQNIEEKIFYAEELFKNKDLKEKIESLDIDYVLIDEVQDFSINDINLFTSLGKKGYFLFGDNSQQIYPERTKRVNIIKEIKNKFNIKHFYLPSTYRVPSKIAELAEDIDKHNTNLSKSCYRISEELPLINEFNSFKEEMKYIINVIENEQWENVGILLKSNPEVRIVAEYLNKISSNLFFEQKSENIKGKHNIDNLDFSNSNPKVLTYHSSKGLEFDRVFIPLCRKDKNEKKYNYREAFFVAMTRAKESLIISYQAGDKSHNIDLFDKKKYIFDKK